MPENNKLPRKFRIRTVVFSLEFIQLPYVFKNPVQTTADPVFFIGGLRSGVNRQRQSLEPKTNQSIQRLIGNIVKICACSRPVSATRL